MPPRLDRATGQGPRRRSSAELHATSLASSGRDHVSGFDGVKHVAGRIPDAEVGLRLVVRVSATNHKRVRTTRRQRELRLPWPKTVFALVGAKLGRPPALAIIDRQIDAGDATVTAEGDTADRYRRPGG